MNLIDKYNVSNCSEYDMQRFVATFFEEYNFRSSDPYNWDDIKAKVYREVGIPKIGRISDVIVMVTSRKIFNIECKLNDTAGVVIQAIDHLKWAE
ncbi:MAG TPA: hypothetical protein ENH82_10610 [bacterium]|nr:hypothetical protein [bacterium]